MKILFIPFLLVFFISCQVKSPNAKVKIEISEINDIKSDVEQKLNMFQSTKDTIYLIQAENKVDSLINNGINDLKLFQVKGNVLRKRKRYVEFAKFMKESTLHFPNNPQTYFGAGVAFDQIKDFESAKEMYKMSIQVYDKLIQAYPTAENHINRIISICFLYGKQEGLQEFEKIAQSGTIKQASFYSYKSIVEGFDKEKFRNSIFNNP
jgi:tetratricopeptide (TPR) repeat protein